MNDPKKPNEEPRRVSQPEQPGQTKPGTEYEKNVPHEHGQPVAMTGDKGEGSYTGTKQYQEGYKKFSQKTSPEDARKKAEKIDPNDPQLREAEQRGKDAGRTTSPSIH